MKKNTKSTAAVKKGGLSTGEKVSLGVIGAAGVALAGAGAYYLMGPDGKTNQKKAKALIAKMKKEVSAEIKKAKKVSAPIYNKVVDTVSKNYAKEYKLAAKDVSAIAKTIKSEWKDVSKQVAKVTKKIK
ncbi:MAG: hypothetical protein AAB510_02660 [Patescibacteria group bacterium]